MAVMNFRDNVYRFVFPAFAGMTRWGSGALVLVFLLLSTRTGYAITRPAAFEGWLRGVEHDALADGISADTLHNALDDVMPDEHVLELDQKQPEKTITFDVYVQKVVSSARIQKGRQLLQDNKDLLADISARYGVLPDIIIALWGIESSYGKAMGDYPVVDSLVTLAYGGRRAEFFRKELMAALHILDEQHIPSSALLGSWAGAMGQCQFMPSTYLHYAVSYGGNRPDIWDNDADVLASIANYLAAEGWRAGQGWGMEVTAAKSIDEGEIGIKNAHSITEWNQLGVRDMQGVALPDSSNAASLLAPDGMHGRLFLVYDNMRAVMRWNRSTYFAASVGLLADRISDDK
jgi:membrane-bound lytic murein transglycosylase B